MGTRNFYNPALGAAFQRNPGLYMGARAVNSSRYMGESAGRQAAGDVAAAAALNKAKPKVLQRSAAVARGPKV